MRKMSGWNNRIKDYICIMLGVTLLAAGLMMFYDPNQMVVGGFSGLAIVIKTYTQQWLGWGMPLSLTNLILNAPLFVLAWKMLGSRALGRTVFATLFYSVAILYTQYLPTYTGDLALAAIYGGVMSGVGVGLVLKGFATTGGTDLVATLLHHVNPRWPVSKLLFASDALIICLGFFVFGAEKAMYAIIAIFISSKCVNVILEGFSVSKMAFIISDSSEEIAQQLMSQADRGVTALRGQGMYTRQEKNVLLCVFPQKDITLVKEIVRQADPKAFVMLTDVREVLGEGFQALENR